MAFSEISNQPSVQKILTTIFSRGLKPAFMLFIGPEGVGKKKAAFVFVQSNLCETPEIPKGGCGRCSSCLRVERNVHPDLHLIDKDYQEILLDIRGSSSRLRIETMRETMRRLQQKPFQSTSSFAIVDEAHDLTDEAQNAMLKMLEEAPRHLVWIWLTGCEEFLLPTVRSRANFRIYFKPQLKAVSAQGIPLPLTPEKIFEMSQRVARFRSATHARKEVAQILSETKSQLFSLWRRDADYRHLSGLRTLLYAERDLELNLTPSLVLESTLLELSDFHK